MIVSTSQVLSAGPSVLADAVRTPSRVRDVLLVAGFSLAIGLSAQLAVPLPFTPVPVTGQTFVVLLGAVALGPARATAGTSGYILLGLAGVPWFASIGTATMGYVVGFVLAAAIVGGIAKRGWARRPLSVGVAMIVGNLVIYAVGVTYLARAVGASYQEALSLGMWPFIPGDVLKIVAAVALVPLAWRMVESGEE